jgi:NADPH:quinone reductase-like Zn-dependent oxidoreductase
MHMKAVRFHSYGSPKVLQYEEAANPELHADEILIRVHSAGVSPFDAHVREGWYKNTPTYPLPCILGWEISGEVAGVGTGGTRFKKGDPVVAHPSVYRSGGGYAEYVAVKESEAVGKPIHVSYNQAAAASMNALVAWQALFDVAHLSHTHRVLIHAAAGGVGHLAVQLAKWKGAYVIGTASAKNKEFLLDIGADEVIDYTHTAFESALDPVDVVLDTIGKDTLAKSFSLIKKSGIAVSIVDFERIKEAPQFGVRGEAVVVSPNSKQLSEIMKLMEEGMLEVHVAKVFHLKDACKAHELLQLGHVKGKIVLEV